MVEEININKDRIIPVIGENAFLYTCSDGTTVSLQQYIVSQFLKNNPRETVSDTEKEIMANSGYYGLSKLKRKFPTNFQARLKKYVKTAKQNISIKKAVKTFLEEFQFPLIITTTGFDIIERELPGYASVHYIYDKTDNHFGEKHELDAKRIVYHLFGNAELEGHWVNCEGELLKAMYSINHTDINHMDLMAYMKLHRSLLLVLDVCIPDWTFRFMMYPLQQDYYDNADKRLGYWCNGASDDSFKDFLNDMYYLSETDVENILLNAVEERRSEMELAPPMQEGDQCEYFISYAGEDIDIAYTIRDILRRNNIHVWFNQNKDEMGVIPGNNYYIDIQKGIDNSRCFLPIVTEHFLKKMRDPATPLYREVSMAAAKGMLSLPVIVEGRAIKKGFSSEMVPITEKYVEMQADCDILPTILFKEISMITLHKNGEKELEKDIMMNYGKR